MDVPEGAPGIQDPAEVPPPPPELEAFSPSRRPAPVASVSLNAPIPREANGGVAALLRNRFILAALGAVALLLLTAIVLVAIGRGDAGGGGSPAVAVQSKGKTPARPAGGLVGTAVTTASYRNGPDARFVILGTIPRGATVAIVGRSEDNAWLQVRYPPASNLKGWVDAKLLDVDGNLAVLAIAGPGPVANAEVTYQPTVAIYEPVGTATEEIVEPTRVPRPTRTATPRPTVTPSRTALPTATSEPLPTATVPTVPPPQ